MSIESRLLTISPGESTPPLPLEVALPVQPVSIEGRPLLVDTPDAYRPQQATGQRYMKDVGELQTQMDTLTESPRFNPDLIATEEAQLKVSYKDDPEAFRLAHNERLFNFKQYLETVIPEVTERTVEQISQYLGKGDTAAAAAWRERLEARMATAPGVLALDHLRSSTLAHMPIFNRSVMVNSAFSFTAMSTARHFIEDIVLPHELIHLMSTAAVLEGALELEVAGPVNLPARTGIATEHVAPEAPAGFVTQAEWLGEASVEDFRGRALGATEFGYTRGLALLRAIKDLDPTLEEVIDSTLFDRTVPALLTQKVEDVLGPLGVNQVEQYVSGESLVWNPTLKVIEQRYSLEEFIVKVQELALPEVREKLGIAFRHHLQTITPMPRLPVGVISMH